MNLISEPWIPVRRANGWQGRVEPWRITDFVHGESPILAVASPRPDFDGALTQFLIGLLQTTCTPKTSDAWWEWRETPPAPERLKESLAAVEEAFEFGGDGPSFMEDLTLSAADFQKKSKHLNVAAQDDDEEGLTPISNLMIDAPGKITNAENRDHFIKRGMVSGLCPHCAAAALFTLQTNSPGRGSGYRTSLRGGGPLTTILVRDKGTGDNRTLWNACWLNVLDATRWLSGKSGNAEKRLMSDRFPWLAKTRTSEKEGSAVTPDDIHPDQQYWAMPQRIRLARGKEEASARCDVCGATRMPIYRHYYAKKFGTSYKGDFRHPLSPYDLLEGHPRAVLSEPGGIGYRHWLGLIENEPNSVRQRAPVIERFVQDSPRDDAWVWAFGFDIYNSNKVRSWADAQLPILELPEEVRELFVPVVKNMVVAANRVCGLTLRALLRASFCKPKSKKLKRGKNGGEFFEIVWEYPKALKKFKKDEEDMDSAVLSNQRALMYSARCAFWENTEQAFIGAMTRIRNALVAGDRAAEFMVLEEWLGNLKKESRRCLELFSALGDFDGPSPRGLSLAEYELNGSLGSPTLRAKLGLP